MLSWPPPSNEKRTGCDMAWHNNSRLSGKQLKGMFRKWRLPSLPDPERDVLKQLGRAQLPLSKAAYQARYNELMAEKAKE